MAAARCMFRVLKTASLAIVHRLGRIDPPIRGSGKLPEHKIWEQESAYLRRGVSIPRAGTPYLEFGLDYEHWLVQVSLPNREMSRDEIINFYVKLLAKAVGRSLSPSLSLPLSLSFA